MAQLYFLCLLHLALVVVSREASNSEVCSSQPDYADCQEPVEDHDASSLLSVHISKHKTYKSIGKAETRSDIHAKQSANIKHGDGAGSLAAALASAGFPDLSGLGGMIGDLSKKVHDELSSLKKKVVEPVLKELASSLQTTLDKVEKLVAGLHKQASLYGTAIGTHIKDAGDHWNSTCDKTRALEEQAKASLNEFATHWTDIQGKIKGGVDAVTTVLDTIGLGEKDFAIQFKAAVNRTDVNSYLKTCEARVTDLHSRCHNTAVLKEAFELMNTTLESTRSEVHTFAKGLFFEKIFNSMTEEISKKVPDLDLESQFKPLVATEGRIVKGIVSSADALISGIGNGIVLCEKTMNSAGHHASVLVSLIVTALASGILGVR